MTSATASPTTWRRRGEQGPDDATIARIDAWWRAANYLSVGQIYLLDNRSSPVAWCMAADPSWSWVRP